MNTFHSRSLLRFQKSVSIPKRTLFKSRSNKLFVPNSLVRACQSLVANQPTPKILQPVSSLQLKPWLKTQPNLMFQDDKTECRSVRSNVSRMSCKSKKSFKSRMDNSMLAQSAVHFDGEADNVKIQELSLSQLQKQIDKLLRQRVNLLLQAKANILPTLGAVSALNRQLQATTKVIVAKAYDDTRSNMSQYRTIDAKVELVERILSQQFVEADILRMFYQLYTYSRTEYGKLGAESPLKHSLLLRQSQAPPPLMAKSLSHSLLINKSTNQESYRKIPKQEYALVHRQQKQKYRFRPQAIPSSSYKENYLNYSGVLALKNVLKYNNNEELIKTPYHPSVGSTYNKQFNRKCTKPIDFRELDSYKDKIKQLKLTYTHIQVKPSEEMSKTMAKLQKQYNIRPQLKPIATHSYTNQFQASTLRDFKHKQGNTFVASTPKNSRLNSLERIYRYSSRKIA